jgi:Uma2 family endonuclease
MVQTPAKPLTLDEFLKLPETKPASEFIDGQIIQKPMPQGKHSTLQLSQGADINLALKPQRIARAYSELRCTFGGRSIVPDIVVFTWERIPRDRKARRKPLALDMGISRYAALAGWILSSKILNKHKLFIQTFAIMVSC